jgi:hypothetical protein
VPRETRFTATRKSLGHWLRGRPERAELETNFERNRPGGSKKFRAGNELRAEPKTGMKNRARTLPRESKTGKPAAPRRENQIHARERETLPAAQGISKNDLRATQ